MTTEQKFIQLRKQIINRDLSRMNDMQFDAVVTVDGPVLILAGAGSGKTTVLINRIATMIKYGTAYNSTSAPFATEEDVKILEECLNSEAQAPDWLGENKVMPYQILAITFTNKAAKELKERLETAIGEAAQDVWAATFHSTCSKILRRYADRLGFSSGYTIYSADDQKRLMKDVMKRLEIDEKFLTHKSILNEISRAKDELIDPVEYKKRTMNDIRLETVARAYSEYQKLLKEFDAMDFDDLLFNTVELFRSNPDILEYYQNRFQYVMIDEYQDTNHAQYVFAKLLSQKHRNICVVGDDDQSIYRFRGATIENILSFEDEYKDAKVIRLEQNYRSTQNILDAANSVISNNTGRKGKSLWTSRKDGEKITLYTASNEVDEAKFIAEQIQDSIASGAKNSDHAILYRMNAQSNAIENVLMRSGISYRVVGGLKFFDRKEIRDLIAYLNLLNNQADGVALKRIINEPKRGIGDTTVAALSALSEQLNLPMLDIARHADEYAHLQRTSSKLKGFADMIDELRDAADSVELPELFDKLLEKTQYIGYLESLGEDGIDRIDNVKEFASSIMLYQSENDEPTLAGFLDEIALITDMDREDDDNDKVWLMTMHTAKGLEFPTVFIVGVEEGIFPSNQTIYGSLEDMEEERRLAYVGITRAKNKLFLTNTFSRMIFGKTERLMPSRFISEIPDSLINKKSAKLQTNVFSNFGSEHNRGGSYNDYGSYSYQKTTYKPSKTYAEPKQTSQNSLTYKVGDSVKHKVFGVGMVVSAVAMGNDVMLEICFDKVGTKRVMSNFAKLEKIK